MGKEGGEVGEESEESVGSSEAHCKFMLSSSCKF
jgi:hypothetical protein